MDPIQTGEAPVNAPMTPEQAQEEAQKQKNLYDYWCKEIQASQKELKPWHTRGTRVVQKYLDQRDDAQANEASSGAFKLNLFWSNTQVIKANLYSKPPKVDIYRTFKDENDDVARVAATILERILNTGMESDSSDFHVATQNAIEDYLLPGMGQVWLRYEVETETVETPAQTDPMTGLEVTPASSYEKIANEDALSDYVYWKDFLYGPARVWEEVPWVARRTFLRRSQAGKRFGEGVAKLLPTHGKQSRKTSGQLKNIDPQNSTWDRIEVYEIWNKSDRKVYWYCYGYEKMLDVKDDPLELDDFFPCPRPLLANTTTSNLIPQPDYVMAQDQYDQIDELTTRIAYLTRACKMIGCYDKKSTELARIFTEGLENQMIPVDNWAAFSEKGGIRGTMDFVPIEVAANVIEKLTVQRDILINKLYEVLGIGDIMRGTSNPNETYGAQQIKAQFGSARIGYRQNDISVWVANAQKIKAQIIAKHWQPETILARSNIMNSTDAEYAGPAVEFIKTMNHDSQFRIKVSPDSMSALDWSKEREERGAAITGLGTFMQSVAGLIETKPEATPMVLSILKWFMGGFRNAKDIETSLDSAIQAASQPKPPTEPTPEQQADAAKAKSEAESRRASAVKALADAAAVGYVAPADAALQEMGLPPNGPVPNPTTVTAETADLKRETDAAQADANRDGQDLDREYKKDAADQDRALTGPPVGAPASHKHQTPIQ